MKQLRIALGLAVVGFGFLGGSVRADETFRLAVYDSAIRESGFQGDADTLLVGGWHRHPAYRSFSYYRSPYSSYYRYPRYSYYAPRWYAPRYSFSFGLGYYRPYASYYYAPPVYYYNPYSCDFPIGLGVETQSLPGGNVTYSVTRPQPTPPSMPAVPDGTYRYDGGPAQPVPMPQADPNPAGAPRLFRLPTETRAVSLPARSGKLVYPAYGEGR